MIRAAICLAAIFAIALALYGTRCKIQREVTLVPVTVVDPNHPEIVQVADPDYLQLFSVSRKRVNSHDVEIVGADGTKWYRRRDPVINLADFDLSMAEIQNDARGRPAIFLWVRDESFERFRSWSREHVGDHGAFMIDQEVQYIAEITPLSHALLLQGFENRDDAAKVLKRIRAGGQSTDEKSPTSKPEARH